MQAELIQGVIAMNKNNIPVIMLICGFINSGGVLTIATLNIITGILKIITIMLPIAKFLLFKRFIDPEIEDNADKIGDPKTKVIITRYIFSLAMLRIKYAQGIIIKKGN